MAMRTGGPKDLKPGPKPVGDEEQRVERTREVKSDKDRYDLEQKSPEDRRQRHELLDAPKKGKGALVAQVLTRAERQLAKLSEEVEAILELLAEAEFGTSAISRHTKKLDRTRHKKDDSSRRQQTQKRGLWEMQVGLTEVAESRLSLSAERLASIRDAGLIALLELIADLGNGSSGPRRLVVRGADRTSALEYAISCTPTTVFLDAPFVALGLLDPFSAQGALGRTLAGQRALEVAAAR